MALGNGADCERIRKEKSENGRLWSEGRRVRRKMNGVGKRSGLRTDPQSKILADVLCRPLMTYGPNVGTRGVCWIHTSFY